jgi:hypothetical protein
LAAAIGISQLEAYDSRARFFLLQAMGEGQNSIQKTFPNSHVGVHKKQPISLTQATTFVDSAGKSPIMAPPSQRNSPSPSQPAGNWVAWRMIIDHNYLGLAGGQAGGPGQLTDQIGRLSPLVIIDNHDGKFWDPIRLDPMV